MLSSLLRVAPPNGPFIFTFNAKVRARFASGVTLIALFSSQATGKAAYGIAYVNDPKNVSDHIVTVAVHT